MTERAHGAQRSAPADKDILAVDVAVVGAGAAGLAAALVFAQDGYSILVCGTPSPRRDGRTVALLDGSVSLLKRLGVWESASPKAAALATMRIIDDTGSVFRPPPLSFHAAEIDLPAFGYNIENADLVTVLGEAAERRPEILMAGVDAGDISFRTNCVSLRLADGRLATASLLVAADGRKSPARAAAGISARDWTYPQAALTTILAHEKDHGEVSTEFHTREGAFTLVPLPGRRSSVVWMMNPERADAMMALDDAALARRIERQARSMLGKMVVEGPRGLAPMGGLSVSRFTAPRLALVGEAAHAFPPIGAQGLNLGLRDVAALRDAVVDQADPGDAAGLDRYERGRRVDVRVRTRGVDLLNRSLLSGFLPVDIARGVGMVMLDQIGPLRRAIMLQGLASREPGTPTLMQAPTGTGSPASARS